MNATTDIRFDFALSFAGADRHTARSIYFALVADGYRVFFDEEFEHEMIGQDGIRYLTDIYAKQSRYCVVLISSSYESSNWTQLERESFQSRELNGERGILIPVKLSSYSPSWLPASRIYFDLLSRPMTDLLKILRAKHRSGTLAPPRFQQQQQTNQVDISGTWSSEERVSNKMSRLGTMNVRQIGADISGVASLVEFYPNGGKIAYDLSLHGEIDQRTGVVRLIGAFLRVVEGYFSRPYSVDTFVARVVDADKLLGSCVDERGLRGELRLDRKKHTVVSSAR